MSNRIIFTYNYIKSKCREKKVTHDKIRVYLNGRRVVKKEKILTAQEGNQYIKNKIQRGQPFFAGRFGANELSAIKTFDFKLSRKYEKVLDYLYTGAGFFPPTLEMGEKFKNMMLNLISQVDFMGVWMLPFEDYYLNKYGSSSLKTTYLLDLEPWSVPENPWSSALEGKKVLVIHPFKETIERQYKRRKDIFPETNILPEFELKTLKAVQTVAGEKDDRFATWFDALDWMYQEAMKIDFDVAIIGCGAYGFPLAAKLKMAGKQAIHLAGATQLLFGIKGKRWEENDAFAYVQKFFNDAWVYPADEDKPKEASKVENGCYW